MLDLETAIKHCEEKAKELREQPFKEKMDIEEVADCEECAEEHEQLTEWLKELKAYKEASKGDLISREALLKAMEEERQYLLARGQTGAEHIIVHHCLPIIDNAPTVELTEEQAIDKLHETGWLIRHDKEITERPHIVRCKDCIHRDPEDKKCVCGRLERQGKPFGVHDNYYCAYAIMRGEEDANT